MDVYIVHTSQTGSDVPIGVYKSQKRAQEIADADAPAVFGKDTQTISDGENAEGVERRVHLIDGNQVGIHAIFRFALDESE
jgi:hypothetical protein